MEENHLEEMVLQFNVLNEVNGTIESGTSKPTNVSACIGDFMAKKLEATCHYA